jgi:hypothetical protein
VGTPSPAFGVSTRTNAAPLVLTSHQFLVKAGTDEEFPADVVLEPGASWEIQSNTLNAAFTASAHASERIAEPNELEP